MLRESIREETLISPGISRNGKQLDTREYIIDVLGDIRIYYCTSR